MAVVVVVRVIYLDGREGHFKKKKKNKELPHKNHR